MHSSGTPNMPSVAATTHSTGPNVHLNNEQDMTHTITKRTSKSRVRSIMKEAVRRSRRKSSGADFSDLLGTAPLHMEPVKFQRALRDEE